MEKMSLKYWGIMLLFLIPLSSFSQYEKFEGPRAFTDVTDSAGIEHQFKVFEGMFGGGICVFDYNNDGFEDLYITSGMNEDVLYHNNGDGTFKNVYVGSGLEDTRAFVTQGVAGADVNRDGWTDLFITTITVKDPDNKIPRAMNLLFLNNGDNTFRNATEEFGLDKLITFSTAPNFGDFNADGYPDLFVGNYFHEYEGGLDLISDATIVNAHKTAKGHLLLNKGGKSFENVYEDYGLSHKGFGFGGVFTDFDNDGDQDLFVNHDFGYKRTPDLLLENLYPKKEFRDVADEYNMDLKINSMGTAIADINEDGILDYYISNIKFNWFMLSQGEGKPYRNKLKERGMKYFAISWGSNFADFDQDGDMDLYVSNGDLNPYCTPMGNFYFVNEGGQFTEDGLAKGVKDYGIGRGSVIFDMENDGDMDILVVNQQAVSHYPIPTTTRLYRNDSTKGNWMKVALEGVEAESDGLGSRLELHVNGKKMLREIDGGGSSHMSQNSRIAHFGLGDAEQVDSIVVRWTGGNIQVVKPEGVNQLISIKEIPQEKSSNMMIWLLLGALILGGIFGLRRMIGKEA
ncbi:MAG: CRTAC1 family protein [Bacteroidota bacterium]